MNEQTQPSIATVIRRGWARRCPNCGEGALFVKGIEVHDNCSNCGIQYLKNRGDYWGFLLVIDRAIFILPLIIIIYFDLLPERDWTIALFFVSVMAGFIATASRRYGLCIGLNYLTNAELRAPNAE